MFTSVVSVFFFFSNNVSSCLKLLIEENLDVFVCVCVCIDYNQAVNVNYLYLLE